MLVITRGYEVFSMGMEIFGTNGTNDPLVNHDVQREIIYKVGPPR